MLHIFRAQQTARHRPKVISWCNFIRNIVNNYKLINLKYSIHLFVPCIFGVKVPLKCPKTSCHGIKLSTNQIVQYTSHIIWPCTGRILYCKISVVFRNGPTSNGVVGPIMLLCYWQEVGLYSVTCINIQVLGILTYKTALENLLA